MLDETMSGETMALSVINKINNKLKFLYRKNRFLTPTLRRLLCNALIQPHFDYACSAWYPSLTKKLKNRIQTSQNKCIRFCLQLDKMTHISHIIYKRCINSIVFKTPLTRLNGQKILTRLNMFKPFDYLTLI